MSGQRRKVRLAPRTEIVWKTTHQLSDVFGKPLEWSVSPVRPVYLNHGVRVRLGNQAAAGFSDDMLDVLNRAAKATGRPRAEIIRRCVVEKLGRST